MATTKGGTTKSVKTKKEKNHALSILLLRDGITPNEALKPGLKHVPVPGMGTLFYEQNPPVPPRWLKFLEEGIPNVPALKTSSSSALLVIRKNGRVFAVSFGFGRFLLKPDTCEPNFGLKVTLNSVDPEKLKSVDRKSFDAISCHTRTQASAPGDVTAFGMNVDQDLLCAATGQPIDSTLGARMTGMDALSVAAPVKLGELPALLGRYHQKFTDDGYKERFPWVDHIGEVRDTKQREKLDETLLAKLRSDEDPSEMSAWLAVPALLDWSKIGGFRYSASTSKELYPDLHLRDFLETFRKRKDLTLELLKSRRVFAFDPDETTLVDDWSAYGCVYAEIVEGGKTFLLSASRWYEVERSFVESVNNAVAGLVRKNSSLPDYDDASEEAYNKRAADGSSGSLALMDRKLIKIGGTTVEFCDLYGKDGQLIHVKKYAGSSVLSHHFAQGTVAANAFISDRTFRQKANQKLPASHKIPEETPVAKNFKIVYAVISRSNKSANEILPFFSRLNLRIAARHLTAYGFKVSLVKIQSLVT